MTYLPSLPTNGESLTRNSIDSVGSSMSSAASGFGSSMSVSDSPSPMPVMPPM